MKMMKYLSLVCLLMVTSIAYAAQADSVQSTCSEQSACELVEQESIRGRKTTYGDALVSRVNRVYDGDTMMVDMHDYPPIVGENISVRVAGIDTPEIRTKDQKEKALAYQVRDYVITRVYSAKKIVLKRMKRGKYFRIIADVFLDNKSLAKELLEKGYALPYEGGKKPDWSEYLKQKEAAA
jgi:endonuclease YncB( thermonuclease family)